nr:hypothetical protein [Abalone asfa-like virus]
MERKSLSTDANYLTAVIIEYDLPPMPKFMPVDHVCFPTNTTHINIEAASHLKYGEELLGVYPDDDDSRTVQDMVKEKPIPTNNDLVEIYHTISEPVEDSKEIMGKHVFFTGADTTDRFVKFYFEDNLPESVVEPLEISRCLVGYYSTWENASDAANEFDFVVGSQKYQIKGIRFEPIWAHKFV